MSELIYRRAMTITDAYLKDETNAESINAKVAAFLVSIALVLTAEELRYRHAPKRNIRISITVTAARPHTTDMRILTSPPRCPLCEGVLP